MDNKQSQVPQYDKRALIIVVSIIGALIISIMLYQAGYSAGVASVPGPDSGSTTEIPVVEDTKPREPVVLSGTGQQATAPFELVSGLATAKLKHSGESNFSIWVLGTNGDRVELLVNEIGSFDGSKAFQVPSNGKYVLDIGADGAWEVTIQQ